jgi:hypothetical protein
MAVIKKFDMIHLSRNFWYFENIFSTKYASSTIQKNTKENLENLRVMLKNLILICHLGSIHHIWLIQQYMTSSLVAGQKKNSQNLKALTWIQNVKKWFLLIFVFARFWMSFKEIQDGIKFYFSLQKSMELKILLK